ncbi:pilus assembly protein PilO [Candidatus Pelagibacter sp.]|nr:pilus assembly protein PilO [Candidatus Pelagibacter sp.]|tara:strand:- start:38 stop:682 length:645 start_codon:yes stop_codon:yes gene_type:complete
MDLNNINFDDIKEKLLNIEKKTLIKYGSVVGAVILFLIIYYAILNPIVKNKRTQLNEMNLKKQEIVKFEKELISIKKKIKKIRPIYKKNSSLFHSKKEVEGLYQTLSQYAEGNGLVVSKINKQKPKPVFLNKKGKVTKKKPKKVSKKNVSYFTIPVKFEIKGNFLGYIRFKQQLSKSNKMLNFEKELIKLEKTGSSGIVVTGELSIVGLTNEFL